MSPEDNSDSTEDATQAIAGLLARIEAIVHSVNDDISPQRLSGQPLVFQRVDQDNLTRRPPLDIADPNTSRFRQLSSMLEGLAEELDQISSTDYDFVALKAHDALSLVERRRTDFIKMEDEAWETLVARLNLQKELSELAAGPVHFNSGELGVNSIRSELTYFTKIDIGAPTLPTETPSISHAFFSSSRSTYYLDLPKLAPISLSDHYPKSSN